MIDIKKYFLEKKNEKIIEIEDRIKSFYDDDVAFQNLVSLAKNLFDLKDFIFFEIKEIYSYPSKSEEHHDGFILSIVRKDMSCLNRKIQIVFDQDSDFDILVSEFDGQYYRPTNRFYEKYIDKVLKIIVDNFISDKFNDYVNDIILDKNFPLLLKEFPFFVFKKGEWYNLIMNNGKIYHNCYIDFDYEDHKARLVCKGNSNILDGLVDTYDNPYLWKRGIKGYYPYDSSSIMDVKLVRKKTNLFDLEKNDSFELLDLDLNPSKEYIFLDKAQFSDKKTICKYCSSKSGNIFLSEKNLEVILNLKNDY